ncbi:RsiV family protein [Mycobacterium sp. Y57]|uniref:RsiV family protein n=1 Tax=Mycolicibacterium xanthum TaxID=2796469 RepID=UPI001C84C1AA|nr:RsiV family protein [Mycolicibacterium xanthum]MBX7432785.1 RsiV family protein [Mycolicibacterium xanthum]
MLITGGRILVAAIGAIVLVVVGIFGLRAVFANPHVPEPIATSTSPSPPPEPPPGGGSPDTGGSGPDGSTPPGTDQGPGGDPGGTGNPPEPEVEETAEPYAATSKPINTLLGTVAVAVDLPQVQGGKPQVAQTFNDAMDSALQEQVDASPGAFLKSSSDSGVRIGEHVLSGVLRSSATKMSPLTTDLLTNTVVVDTDSGELMNLASLFTDLDQGLSRLRVLANDLGSTSTAGAAFDGSALPAEEEPFSQWTAEPEGMRIFFAPGAVAPDDEGVVELTIPWDRFGAVVRPDVREIVSS